MRAEHLTETEQVPDNGNLGFELMNSAMFRIC